jgi:hypothetical protein
MEQVNRMDWVTAVPCDISSSPVCMDEPLNVDFSGLHLTVWPSMTNTPGYSPAQRHHLVRFYL